MAPSHSRIANNLWSDSVKDLRRIMKNRSRSTASGYLAESTAMEMLEANDVFFMRFPEAGSVDGCLIVRKDKKPATTAQRQMGMTELYDFVEREAAKADSDWEYIPFDIKYMSLLPGGLKGQDYAYLNPPAQSRTELASFYMLVFEDDLKNIALLPKHVFDQNTDIEFGIQPLTGKVPSWCFPYMVHVGQLGDAITSLSLTDAKSKSWYTNPTTTSVIAEWVPPRLPQVPIFYDAEASKRHHNSWIACRQLWADLERGGCKVYANPVAPIWCDFLVDIEPGLESARIEHKYASKISGSVGNYAFAVGRQWHFLMVQIPGQCHVCIPQQDIQFNWRAAENHTVKLLMKNPSFIFDDDEAGVRRMISFMREKLPGAIKAVNAIVANPPRDGYLVRAMFSSNSIRTQELEEDGELDMEEVRREVMRLHHAKGLWWLGPSMNRRLCEIGRGVILTMDVRHPVTSNVLVDHIWTAEDKADFLQYHRLPVSPYDAVQQGAIAVPLQFLDLSVSARGANVYPLFMREAYWLSPVNQQKTIMIGSPTKARIQEKTKLTAAYVIIPSGVTTKHSQGVRQPNRQVDPALGTGLQYFRKYTVQKDEALPTPTFSSTSTEVKVLKQGSAFFNDDTYNPLRYILPEDTLARLFVELLSGPDDETMTIQNPQTRVAGIQITKGEYRTTLAALHQAACTHGLFCKMEANLKTAAKDDDDSEDEVQLVVDDDSGDDDYGSNEYERSEDDDDGSNEYEESGDEDF